MNNCQDKHWALSGAQSGIWFATELEPDNPIYNTGEYIEINGIINIDYFKTGDKNCRSRSTITTC